MEWNGACSDASPLTFGLYPNLQLCRGDFDWYSVDLQAGDVMTVTMRFGHAQGDLDMWLYASGCWPVIERGQSTTDDERIVYTATSTETVFPWVKGKYGTEENSYSVEVQIRSPQTTVYLPLVRRR